MTKGLVTRGLDAESADIASWRAPQDRLAFYIALVQRIHAWDCGGLSTSELRAAIIEAVQTHPKFGPLKFICTWIDRLIDVEAQFASVYEEMSHSSAYAVRVHCAWRLNSIDLPPHRDRFRRLLNDRSKVVRRQVVIQAEINRWSGALDDLASRLLVELDDELRLLLQETIEIIRNGYRVLNWGEGPSWVTCYSGSSSPGGVGAATSKAVTRATLRVLKRLCKIENEFLARHGHWPTRPMHYPHEDMEVLSRWTPDMYSGRPH